MWERHQTWTYEEMDPLNQWRLTLTSGNVCLLHYDIWLFLVANHTVATKLLIQCLCISCFCRPFLFQNHEEVCCSLKTSVPLLACTLPNWQVVLVDTPGAGDSNTHVAVAAKGALKFSSAYVFVTTYDAIESAENANFIKFLHDHDKGTWQGVWASEVILC